MNGKKYIIPLLAAMLVLAALLGIVVGGAGIPVKDSVYALFHPGSADELQTIIWKIRVPRVLLGMIIGAGLAASGCVFKGILRNPLADPYTLGVSGGAALGTTIGIMLGLGAYLLPLSGFAGALVCIFLVYAIAARKYLSVSALILAGVILSFVSGACVMLIFALLSADRMQQAMLWLMGDLATADISLIRSSGLFVLAGMIILFSYSREIDILTLGEEKAAQLGVSTQNLLRVLFVLSSLIAGACVCASGIIGFVGLIVPHFMRRLTGPGHALLMPASALGGAIFLVLCDTIARSIIQPIELPVGVITGILGGVVFIVFMLRMKSREIF
jgi:iron complex transport system permease protein